MKSYKLICLFALTAVAFSLAGCRNRVQNPTPLWGYGKTGLPPDESFKLKPIEPGDKVNPNTVPNTIDTKTGGIPDTGKIQDWPPSSEQPFKSDTVYFDLDKSTIKNSETEKLDRIASQMKQKYQGKGLRIEGHCDERGTEEYNRSLGARRAASIREYLVRAGMNSEYVDTISYGEDRPAVPGHTEAAWAKNRRGEFILLEPPK
jgi:peptidoglycan-associated lipoprotein